MKNQKNIELAKKRITHAKKNKLRYLDLRGLFLTEIPMDISDMIYLFDIDLSYNRFTKLPEDVASLTNIRYLDISYNHLLEFELISGLNYSFFEIDFSNNDLNYIPDELDYLNQDTKIKFEGNPFLDGLPEELLEKEDLSYISYYFDSLRRRDNKKRLFETKLLIVGKGDVGKTSFIKVLKNPSYEIELGKEKTTHGINVEEYRKDIIFPAKQPYYNKDEDFDNLLERRFINVSHPDSIGLQGDNEEVYEELNKLKYLPVELKIDIQTSNNPKHYLNQLYFPKNVKINIWDFGGQEILYSTHQFFLTKRSLYILVWEPRADNEDESFDYWLSTIKRLSENSPVLVVMNKSDIRIKSIDEHSYKSKFKNIVGFYKISCYTKEGLKELSRTIDDEISKLPHIGDSLVSSWDKIREDLKKVKADYIDYKKFKQICNTNSEKKVNYLSDYLNDLGDIIHFKDDFRLNNLVIINPSWLTKAIYELIHSVEIQRNKGFFHADSLSSYLNNQRYPKNKHFEIILLMEKFEICFKILGSNNDYIIPTLLQASPIDNQIIEEFQTYDSLKLEISYEFMPSGVIERLICRLNNYIEGNNYWKYGVVFNTEISRAVVISNRLKRTISIFVIGEAKANLYNVIFHELSEIHKDLKLNSKDYKERLACNCNNCVNDKSPWMVERKVLLNFLSKGKYQTSCLKSTEDINIEDLLIGYRSKSRKVSLILDFVNAFSQLQTKKKTLKKLDEDERNTYLNTLLKPALKSKDYSSFEQARRGVSESGKMQGELDIVIDHFESETPISFFEGFNLQFLSKNVINRHIRKTILNYDSNGLHEKFIGVYCEAKNFSDLVDKYSNHLNNIRFEGVEIVSNQDKSNIYLNASEMKVLKTTYIRNNKELFLYHILVNLH